MVINKDEIIGKKFNKLTVLSYDSTVGYEHFYLCECECTNKRVVERRMLLNNKTKSCGCMNKEIFKESNEKKRKYKNAKDGDRILTTWRGMKSRCYNVNNKSYIDYGARGITMCNEWLESFDEFYEWAMNNGYTDELTIERIDYNGNYEPNNCKWVTKKAQNRNTRKSIIVCYNGEDIQLTDLLERLGISERYHLVYKRLRRGVHIDDAVLIDTNNK